MKEWVSVQVGHHDDVGPTIMNWEQQGWHLFSYSTAGTGNSWNIVNHYLLFYRGE